MLTFGRDHGGVAWDHWLAQFKGKPALEALVRALFVTAGPLDSAFRDMVLKRGLDTAEGAQLDGIGQIVGQARTVDRSVFLAFFGFASQVAGRGFGKAPMRRQNEAWADATTLPDSDYRTLLRLKIAQNNGHGTTPEIMAAVRAIFRVKHVVVQNQGNATIAVTVGRLLRADEILAAHAVDFIPVAAGVGISFAQSPAKVFGFSNQHLLGFGRGTLARAFAA